MLRIRSALSLSVILSIIIPFTHFAMQHPELPIISFLCFVMVLAVLPAHLRAGSVATIALIAWLSIMSLIRGVDSLIWADNFNIKVPVWCDITTKIAVGFNLAVPTAALCVLKHLASIASAKYANTTSVEKRRRQIFEGVMCFGLPIVFMALHYIVQGHRFDLYEYFGCQPTIYYSVAAIFLYYGPPLLMSCISFIFALLSLYRFLRLRINFSLHLRNNNSALSTSRYFRLMAMAVVVNMWDTSINTYIIVYTNQVDGGLRPWISWANVHSNWTFIAVYPTELFPPSLFSQVLFIWWIVPISCFIFFIFFGFGSEALADYRAVATWIRTRILRQKSGHSPVLPFTQSHMHHVAVDTPTSHQSHQKLWDDSTSVTTTQEVKPRSLSIPSSVISSIPPIISSQATSDMPHPYVVLPEVDSGKSYPNSLEGITYVESHQRALPVDASVAEARNPRDADTASPCSRQSWQSSQSHDRQDQPPVHDEIDSAHDFVVVPRTLSLDLVPRAF